MKRLGEFLPQFLARYGLTDQFIENKAIYYWEQAVGREISRHTNPQYIEHNTLHVAVSDSVWRHELIFLKSKIIDKLNELLRKDAQIKVLKKDPGATIVQDIKFHLK
ncbi:MAG: DUF721 domain-containing protein [candidate division WOR-3 bacterium]|nr:DUF721 domain-containing protein [candidate division WOR-3 bacterium]